MSKLSKYVRSGLAMLLVFGMLFSMNAVAFADGEEEYAAEVQEEVVEPETYEFYNSITGEYFTGLNADQYQFQVARYQAMLAKIKAEQEAAAKADAEKKAAEDAKETETAEEVKETEVVEVVEETEVAEEVEETEVVEVVEETEVAEEVEETEVAEEVEEAEVAEEVEETEAAEEVEEIEVAEEAEEAETAEEVEETEAAEEVVETEAAEEVVETEIAEEVAEEVKETEVAEEAEEDDDYYVEYIVGDKVVKVKGSESITVDELLAGLGVEVPEGAEVAVVPESVDTENLTVTDADGKLTVSSNGEFFEADRDLVVTVNGEATTIKVVDDETAAHFASRTEGKDTVLKDNVKIEDNASDTVTYTKDTVVDLAGHVIYGTKDAEFVFIVDGAGAVDPVTVTFKNGTIEAHESAVKAVGNAVVKFFNMTIHAAKEALHLDSSANTGTTATTAFVDSRTSLVTTPEQAKQPPEFHDTVVLEGNNSDLYVDGDIINYAHGYTIGKTNFTPAKDDSIIRLFDDAHLDAVNKTQDLAPEIAPDDVYSYGATFAHSRSLNKTFRLVLDLNYDTEFRYITADSWIAVPESPERYGYTFAGWNTRPDGSGAYMTGDYAFGHGYHRLFAIWTPVDPDYSWLIKGTVLSTSNNRYVAKTRMDITNKTANVYFHYDNEHKSPVKVEFLDVKRLMDKGADTVKLELEKGIYMQIKLKDLLDKGSKNANTFTLERATDGLVSVKSGIDDIFCFNMNELKDVTKNDLTLRYENSTVTVLYGKDEICDTKLPDGQYSQVKLDAKGRVLSVTKANSSTPTK